MNLSRAFDIARSSLGVASARTAVLSRNISSANESGYARRSALVTSDDTGSAISGIERKADERLHADLLRSTSEAAASRPVLDHLSALNEVLGNDAGTAPAALLQTLNDCLQVFAASPGDLGLAQEALQAADQLAKGLNAASRTIAGQREIADQSIADSVGALNDALAEFKPLNDSIVRGVELGADVNDALDERDRLLARMAEQIGITTITRPNGDMAVYAENGITLFDRQPRPVEFTPTEPFTTGTRGNAVVIDKVPVLGPGSVMQVATGRLAGLIKARDELPATLQTQIDEIARGLVVAFQESDQSGTSGKPNRPGLFIVAAGIDPAVPGTANAIMVNASADPARGGVLSRLRDGGLSVPFDSDYVTNKTGGAGFAGRLNALVQALGAPRSFDPAGEIDATASLHEYAAGSQGWIGARLSEASSRHDAADALQQRQSQALGNATGVNIDEELARMFEIERSYEGSAKLLSVVDQMFGSLFAAVG